ncbi:GNAT family N-acetyltransferase [Niabella drilacis]|uniref:ElaA protein n=1 Tax=Niabella drilacis (strain DSM 25811 / CCM 8410 / CCUG 62505 / LMG 26954 / E90) TaxID=1285928 RepID=A0A1G6I549_NIADE|nr:GNAT family N-acetyltransferase [Niabella drilacis]SDC01570.1 ElaA protein [Niabella drilacis]
MQQQPDIGWVCRSFDQLTLTELYAILQLRAAVFVVEQACMYQDVDGKDPNAFHLTGNYNGAVVAYTRLLPPGISYSEPSIGRVVVASSHRALGIGKMLMQRSIEECHRLFGEKPIRISAQLYLKTFYRSFGFEPAGDIYDEDGIPHIEMVKGS